jgi:hypothetical protein
MVETSTKLSYSQQLAEVRSMPQSADKKLAAQKFRMENRLFWANFALYLKKIFCGRRAAAPFESNFLEDEYPNPEMASALYEGFVQRKDDVAAALQELRGDATPDTTKPSFYDKLVTSKIYTAMSGKQSSRAYIDLLDTTLAIGLGASVPEDYADLGGTAGSAGYFTADPQIRISRTTRIDVPFIVSSEYHRSRKGEEIIDHEVQHSIHDVLVGVLKGNNRTLSVWGSDPSIEFEVVKRADFSHFVEHTLLPYCLSAVKDEILVRFRNHIPDRDYTESILCEKDGLYDKLSQFLQVYKTKGLFWQITDRTLQVSHRNVLDRYFGVVKEALSAIYDLSERYKDNDLYIRLQVIPYLFAQVPLTEWRKVADQEFIPEVKYYGEAVRRVFAAYEDIFIAFTLISDLPGKQLGDRKAEIVKQLKGLLRRISKLGHSFLQETRFEHTHTLYHFSDQIMTECGDIENQLVEIIGEEFYREVATQYALNEEPTEFRYRGKPDRTAITRTTSSVESQTQPAPEAVRVPELEATTLSAP